MGEGLQNEYIFSAVHEISRTFERFTPKTSTHPTPPLFIFLLIFWAVHDISRTLVEFLTPQNPSWHPPGVGCVNIFFKLRMSPISMRLCVPNLDAVRRSCRKKGVQTQTDRQRDAAALYSRFVVCLVSVNVCVMLICCRNKMQTEHRNQLNAIVL